MFRFNLDNHPENNATVHTFSPIPNPDAELANTFHVQVFCEIDSCRSYWQAPLHPDSMPLCVFATYMGVMMPTRTLKGGCNSTANFQEKVEPCFAELRDNFEAWLDDFLLYAASENPLMQLLRRFLTICRERHLVISLPKSAFFLKEAQWWGRIIDSAGVRFNAKNFLRVDRLFSPNNRLQNSANMSM